MTENGNKKYPSEPCGSTSEEPNAIVDAKEHGHGLDAALNELRKRLSNYRGMFCDGFSLGVAVANSAGIPFAEQRESIRSKMADVAAQVLELPLVSQPQTQAAKIHVGLTLCAANPAAAHFRVASVSVSHEVLVAGRYLKLKRGVSQTPWIPAGASRPLTEHSVSGCIEATLSRMLRFDASTFVPAGREDADVRMLGSGRPFYLRILNPRCVNVVQEAKMPEPKALQFAINEEWEGTITVNDVCYVTNECTGRIKAGEIEKKKQYSCLVYAPNAKDENIAAANAEFVGRKNDFGIYQRTPLRVLHRRANLERIRHIYSLTVKRDTLSKYNFHENICEVKRPAKEGEDDSGPWLRVDMETQAGTYVKEFVTGDLGRTTPSLSDLLGVSADIFELDVTHVDMLWPPIPETSSKC